MAANSEDDHEQIEGSGSHDGARAEVASLEILIKHFDNGQHYLGSGGSKSHQSQVGYSLIPDLEL